MSGGLTPGRGHDRPDVFGRGAAAAADDVDQTLLGELAQRIARVARLLVVRAHLVRQARVRMTRDPGRRHPGEILDERTHLRRAQGAVDSHDEGVRVLDREPERVDRLAREVAAAAVDRREGDPERKLRRLVEGGCDRSLRVERVEDRLDQQEIDRASRETADLFGIGVADLVEGVRTERRIVDARRERQSDVERTDRAGDEAADLVGRLARQPSPGNVHLVGTALEPVVRLSDRGRREGVRRGDVGPGGEVVAMDPEDDLGPCQVE